MLRLHEMVALMATSALGLGAQSRPSRNPDHYEPLGRVIFAQPRLANFTSERPLTKRQRRRQRGKGKP